MSSPFGPMRLIVNPGAGRGRVGKETLPDLRAALRERGLAYDVVTTDGPGSGAQLARAALDEGVRYLVAVGGDGTVHEVVNGMFADERPVAPDAVMGAVGTGSGCDFVRTFGLDRPVERVVAHLDGDKGMALDVGVVELDDAAGNARTRLFINVAEVGWGADVVRRAQRLPRFVGRVRYLLAAYAAIARLDRQETDVEVAAGSNRFPVVNLVVANCQFFGGGMKVAPRALPDDGRFNVQVFTGQRSQVFLLTTQIYRGEHLPHPEIAEFQSPTCALAPERPLPVEADGEVIGVTPARFRILPRALRFKL